jgi:hypothetical protein
MKNPYVVAILAATLAGVTLNSRAARSGSKAGIKNESKTFLESCRRVFSELRSIEDELAQTKGVPKGKLRASMPLNGMLMVPTLDNFIRDYPDVDLDPDGLPGVPLCPRTPDMATTVSERFAHARQEFLEQAAHRPHAERREQLSQAIEDLLDHTPTEPRPLDGGRPPNAKGHADA